MLLIFGNFTLWMIIDNGLGFLLRLINTARCHSRECGNPGLDARFHGHDNKNVRKTDKDYNSI